MKRAHKSKMHITVYRFLRPWVACREAEAAKRVALEKQRAAQGLGPQGQAAERELQATAAEIEANKRCGLSLMTEYGEICLAVTAKDAASFKHSSMYGWRMILLTRFQACQQYLYMYLYQNVKCEVGVCTRHYIVSQCEAYYMNSFVESLNWHVKG